jgi:hypothetical protein
MYTLVNMGGYGEIWNVKDGISKDLVMLNTT